MTVSLDKEESSLLISWHFPLGSSTEESENIELYGSIYRLLTMKVIFIPGNGGGSPKDNWFPYLQKELEKLGIAVVASEFPDNYLARESYWIPFLKNHLQPDEQTVLVGQDLYPLPSLKSLKSLMSFCLAQPSGFLPRTDPQAPISLA